MRKTVTLAVAVTGAPSGTGRLHLAETWELPTAWTDPQSGRMGAIIHGKHTNIAHCPYDGNIWGFGGDGFHPALPAPASSFVCGFFRINVRTGLYDEWYPRLGKEGKEFPYLHCAAGWTWDSRQRWFRSETQRGSVPNSNYPAPVGIDGGGQAAWIFDPATGEFTKEPTRGYLGSSPKGHVYYEAGNCTIMVIDRGAMNVVFYNDDGSFRQVKNVGLGGFQFDNHGVWGSFLPVIDEQRKRCYYWYPPTGQIISIDISNLTPATTRCPTKLVASPPGATSLKTIAPDALYGGILQGQMAVCFVPMRGQLVIFPGSPRSEGWISNAKGFGGPGTARPFTDTTGKVYENGVKTAAPRWLSTLAPEDWMMVYDVETWEKIPHNVKWEPLDEKDAQNANAAVHSPAIDAIVVQPTGAGNAKVGARYLVLKWKAP